MKSAIGFGLSLWLLSGCGTLDQAVQFASDIGEAAAEQAAASGAAVVEAAKGVATGGGVPALIILGGAVAAFVAGVVARYIRKRTKGT